MLKTDRRIDNQVTGDSVIFLQTAEETKGELLRIEYIVTRRESVPVVPMHVHEKSAERFEVSRGKLGVIVGQTNEPHILAVGESVLIPAGTPHTFWNAGDDDLHFFTDVTPAGHFQTYWETMFGLARDGKVNAQGMPNLLQLMVVAQIADSYTLDAPRPLLKAIIALMGPIGRLFGYRASYPAYSN